MVKRVGWSKTSPHGGNCRFDFDGDNREKLVCELNGEHWVLLLYGVRGVKVLKEMLGLGILVGDALAAAESLGLSDNNYPGSNS